MSGRPLVTGAAAGGVDGGALSFAADERGRRLVLGPRRAARLGGL